MTIKAIAFDAYGTLLDVYSVGALAEKLFPGKGAAIAITWRDKQIEYTRLRTVCDRFVDFWQVTGDALDYACEAQGVDLTADARTALMAEYEELTAFAENHAALTRLRDAGIPMAVLTNGSAGMIAAALKAAKLAGFFDHVLSADSVSKFKTAPEVYQMGPDAFGCVASEILFVSSNCWDICGATWFGYHTIWLNRYDQPMERLGVEPKARGETLTDVADYLLG
ncbi:haloacid dehalogenase type II [Aliiroseovarius sp. F47248L]|uniref:haloacid dehalogenase type II n=1 Tax=Aliiroseovarius sp. F47248L TaxID=2926420 RepID=UPI001FF3E284|nr:haloacid dehalogenase type II [Aliiroseovarius sp. F47248L]MCK0139979.1 haloacid dehalogenase type II [Aliiroseovarius sp. F47248L]